MFSTKTLAIVGAALALSGCVQAPGHMQPDFSYAVRQNIAVQIADPEARYARVVNPASSGARATLAQERYVYGQVVQPSAEGTGAINMSGASPGAGAPPPSGPN